VFEGVCAGRFVWEWRHFLFNKPPDSVLLPGSNLKPFEYASIHFSSGIGGHGALLWNVTAQSYAQIRERTLSHMGLAGEHSNQLSVLEGCKDRTVVRLLVTDGDGCLITSGKEVSFRENLLAIHTCT
jgi:hypothetical protein